MDRARASDEVTSLQAEIAALRVENERLRGLLGLDEREADSPQAAPTLFPDVPSDLPTGSVTNGSPPHAKIELFRSLFAGRDDVYATRWRNEHTGKAGWSPAVKGGWANARKPSREYLPYTDDVAARHLAGECHAGLYPLVRGDVCRLLVCDFDGPSWVLDALAYLDAARAAGLAPAMERSQSGDGGHVWLFFRGKVAAAAARRIGVHLLRQAMTVRAELDLASYDRLFPAQDFVPKGSFGNLIALPLQGECRKRGTTVFSDPATLEPFADQWSFLSSLPRTGAKQAAVLAEQFGELAIGPDSATFRSPAKSTQPAPPVIKGSAAAMLAINRIGVPSALLAALKHAASHHNPEFYEKEKHRFSTWNTPRIIRCYRETLDALLLPRGLRDKAATLITEAGSRLEVTDRYADTEPIDLAAQMVLTADQATARDAMSKHDLGVLVAPPGSGKTVVGCALIARHSTPTLVIVDRKPLVEQWRDRLQTHLGLTTRQIGQIGGGRKRAGGLVDVAMIQSLARREDIAELTSRYGLVIVDECHHVPAVTFERAVREMPVRKWLGLTATPYRRDGLQALMAMHCGPTRHRMPEQSRIALLSRDLIVHHTDHRGAENDQHIQAVFRALVEDDKRTRYIASEIGQALATGRNCLVLTRWTEHLGRITDALREQGHNPLVLHGGVAKMARAATIEQLDNASGNQPMLLVATASLLGEGFDCPPLDTLFLAFPIKFKGSVVQCVGRILRPTDTKTRIEVHDYVDVEVSVLARMHEARLSAYKSLGFDVPRTRPPEPDPGTDRPSTIIDNE